MNKVYTSYSLAIVIAASGCGVSPSGDPGQCALKCSKAKIGDSLNMMVTPINIPEKFTCIDGPGLFERPVVLSFRVTNKVPGAAYGKKDGETVDVAVGGLSFLAETSGGVFAVSKSSTENGTFDSDAKTVFTPSQYAGIATPKSEWCTDECGVLTIQVWPQCPPPGYDLNGTLSVRSGGLAPESPVNITVSTAEPNLLTSPGLKTGFERPLPTSTFL
jgi:hypothetical protein